LLSPPLPPSPSPTLFPYTTLFRSLEVRYAENADTLLERLAAENRATEVVCLVSSDVAVRGTSGQEVQKRSSATFLGDMEAISHRSEEHTSELQSRGHLVCRLLLEK